MSNMSAGRRGETAIDLFDRWLAHRQQQADADVLPADVEQEPPASDGRLVLEALTEQLLQPPPPVGDATTLGSAPLPELIVFTPVRSTQRLFSVLFSVSVVAVAVAAYAAWQSRSATMVIFLAALAGLAAVAALAFLPWSPRGREAGASVRVEDGLLRIEHAGRRHEFPLIGTYPPIDVIGEPGDADWKVEIQRRGMDPYVVDSAMVDPVEFTRVFRQFRPSA